MMEPEDRIIGFLFMLLAISIVALTLVGSKLAEADGKPTATCEIGDILIKHGGTTYTCNAYNQYRMVEVNK